MAYTWLLKNFTLGAFNEGSPSNSTVWWWNGISSRAVVPPRHRSLYI